MKRIFLFVMLSVWAVPAFSQLNGQYSVDASSPATTTNYQSVNAAVSDLTSGTRSDGGPVNGPGVTGPVTIRLAAGSGPYVQQVTFTTIPGASAVNTVRLTGGPGRETITFTGTSTGNRHTVKINGARHIILDSLTVINNGNPYAYGIHITNSADSNVVSNCSVVISNTATGLDFAGIVIAGTSIVTNGDCGDGNLIVNNDVSGGYYGITMRGLSTTAFNQRNRVIGNTIHDFYYHGVHCYYQNLTEIKGNTLTARATAATSGYGIYINYVDRFAIEGNIMHSLGGYGIYGAYANYQNGTGTGRATIINNMIGGQWRNSSTTQGIYLVNTPRNIDFFHNSIWLNSGGSNALYMDSGNGHDIRNNSFAVSGSAAGFALNIASAAFVNTVDYNNYYAPASSNFIYIGAAYSIATYVGGGGFNTNSRHGDPVYQSATNLHTTGFQLFDAGTNVGVTTDIDGNARPMAPTLLYEIGADEYPMIVNDAGISAMASPATPFSAGVHNVDAVVFNFGSAMLTSATVNWDVNTVLQAPFAWTGNVSTFTGSAPVTIGTYNFTAGNSYDVRIWTSNPNGVSDPQNSNDTFQISLCVGLNGVYTIGGVGADYATINEAVDALICGGVAGPVTMNLTQGAGPFNEQVIIPAIPGASPARPIRFNGGANRETVQFGATTNTERAVFKLNGADHITLDSMTIINTGATYGHGIHLTNGADSNTVKNCIVTVNATSTVQNFAGITISGLAPVSTGNTGDGNLIQDNTVSGGVYGITIVGTSTTVFNQRNRVTGNTIQHFFTTGIYCYYQDETEIIGNTLTARTVAATGGYGIYLNYVDRFRVEQNTLYHIGGTGIYTFAGNYQNATGTARATIINNMIGGDWVGTNAYGIHIHTISRHIDIFHNSVSMDNGDGRGIYIAAGFDLDVRNNSFAVFGSTAGYPLYISSPLYVATVDYNNYYAPGSSNFIYIGSAYSTSTYVGGGGFNTNSRDGDPYYMNTANDLHSFVGQLYDAGTNTGVNTDIDGDVRPMAPSVGYDIGADEFTVVTDDNSVVQVYSPSNYSCTDSNTVVSVIITNLGADPITSMPLTAVITGYTTATLNTTYTGNLLFGQSDTVVIGTFNSFPGGTLNIVAYSALPGDQNIGNDTVSPGITINPFAPVATGTGDTICSGSATTVFVNADGFPHSWYNAPTGGNHLANGDTLITPVLSASTTYYAESWTGSANTLTTTFAGGAGCFGAMFDIVPAVNMIVDSFAVNIGITTSQNVRVFVCTTGTYLGNEMNPSVWMQMGLVSVIGQGAGQPTMVPIGNINMIAGQTYGIYVVLTSANLDYTTGTNSYTNGEMTINTGAGTCGAFMSVSPGQSFNGTVYYTKEICPNPVRTPITVSVENSPVVALGNDTSVCAAFVLDAGNAGSTYLWSTSQTTQQITVAASGQYSVTVSDANCSDSDTLTVTVNQPPVVTLTFPLDTLCLNGGAITLSGESPVGGTWSGTGVSGNSFDPAIAGIGTTVIVYNYTDANGCSGTTSDSLWVDLCSGMLQDPNGTTAVNVLPNPNNGAFTLSVNGPENVTITIYDALGRIVITGQFAPGAHPLVIADAGVYTISMINNAGTQTIRTVVVE